MKLSAVYSSVIMNRRYHAATHRLPTDSGRKALKSLSGRGSRPMNADQALNQNPGLFSFKVNPPFLRKSASYSKSLKILFLQVRVNAFDQCIVNCACSNCLFDGDVPDYRRSRPHGQALHRGVARSRVVAFVHAAGQGDGRAVVEEQVLQERPDLGPDRQAS